MAGMVLKSRISSNGVGRAKGLAKGRTTRSGAEMADALSLREEAELPGSQKYSIPSWRVKIDQRSLAALADSENQSGAFTLDALRLYRVGIQSDMRNRDLTPKKSSRDTDTLALLDTVIRNRSKLQKMQAAYGNANFSGDDGGKAKIDRSIQPEARSLADQCRQARQNPELDLSDRVVSFSGSLAGTDISHSFFLNWVHVKGQDYLIVHDQGDSRAVDGRVKPRVIPVEFSDRSGANSAGKTQKFWADLATLMVKKDTYRAQRKSLENLLLRHQVLRSVPSELEDIANFGQKDMGVAQRCVWKNLSGIHVKEFLKWTEGVDRVMSETPGLQKFDSKKAKQLILRTVY
jgi:hypothetical protein